MAEAVHPGIRIREEVIEPSGLTISELAKLCGVSRQALHSVLSGKSRLTINMVQRLRKVLVFSQSLVEQWIADYEMGAPRKSRRHSGARLSDALLATSLDIDRWCTTIEARHTLPRLVRQLVRAAVPDASVDFPAYQDVQLTGWDGSVESPRRKDFVPAGESKWELSTEANPARKAEQDHQNRKNATDPSVAKTVTYVALTGRRWPGKKAWVATKNKERFWARVHAYDAVDIEQWLEVTPDVAIWFAEQIGKRPLGLASLDDFWAQFRESTSPPISPQLLLAGRDAAAERVRDWFKSGGGVLRVLADSKDEALAFFAATLIADQDIESPEDSLARVILAADTDIARQLAGNVGALTLGWRLDDPALLGLLTQRGHRAFVAIGRSVADDDTFDIQLPRLERAKFVNAVEAALKAYPAEGENYQARARDAGEEAALRARKCGRSITAYRRLFGSAKLKLIPEWARPEKIHELIPILFAGSWSDSAEADQRAISDLADVSYEEVSRRLSRWQHQPDSPVRKIGDMWLLTAPMDAWSLVASSITEADRTRYRRVILAVLGESDPALALPAGERWQASFRKAVFRHSGALRRGLAESLILHGLICESETIPRTKLSSSIVGQLLRDADADRWRSLHSVLRFLAEAAPDAFLRALETDLDHPNPGVLALFESDGAPMGGGYRHTSLLWGLELLARYKEYFLQTSQLLARLSHAAREVKIGNKPISSLKEIHCVWHRNTEADEGLRFAAIDAVIREDTAIGWQLLISLLPQGYAVAMNTAEPRWLPKPDLVPVTYGEIWRINNHLVRKAMDISAHNVAYLGELISQIGPWPPELRRQLRTTIESIAPVGSPERSDLWARLRTFLSGSGRWSLPDEELSDWDATLERLAPTDLVERVSWLFDNDLILLPRPRSTPITVGGTEAMDREVKALRRKAVAEVVEQCGLRGVYALVKNCKLPYLVGIAAAEINRDDSGAIETVAEAFNNDDDRIRNFGLAFAATWCERTGGDVFHKYLDSPSFRSWPATRQAEYCLMFPVDKRSSWALVAQLGPDVDADYWGRVRVFIGNLNAEDAEFVIRKLLAAGRVFVALQDAGIYSKMLPPDLLVELLDRLAHDLNEHQAEAFDGMVLHYVEQILGQLRTSTVPEDVLVRLEWLYLPLLRYRDTPITLHKRLQNSPEFFVEVLKYAYKPEDDHQSSDESMSPQARGRATAAWTLLNGWHLPPGKGEDGKVDFTKLADWVRCARDLCRNVNRLGVGDDRIGHVLGYVPAGTDGVWPPQELRELIQQLKSDELESGLQASKINQRGVYTKHPLDGGRAERGLAHQYRQWASRCLRWPRAARLLTDLAETYEGFGKISDVTSAQFDLD